MNGSCGIAIILDRIISRGMVLRSRPSTVIVPEELSMMRRKVERRELLPLWSSAVVDHTVDGFTCLPVRPQIPTFSPCLMLTETSRNAGIFSLFDS